MSIRGRLRFFHARLPGAAALLIAAGKPMSKPLSCHESCRVEASARTTPPLTPELCDYAALLVSPHLLEPNHITGGS